MRLSLFSLLGVLLVSTTAKTHNPEPHHNSLSDRSQPQDPTLHTHTKRRGIGRGGGIIRGGGTSGSSKPPPSTLGNSNHGGRTSTGSGIAPAYGGFYAGGSRVPYRSGMPYRGVTPFLLVGGGLGFWSGGAHAWGPYGAYAYSFEERITIMDGDTNMNVTVDVLCLCRRYVECSCQGNAGKAYVRALVDRYGGRDGDVVQVTVINGSQTAVVNGTLANGTTASGRAATGKRGLVEEAVWGIGALAVGWSLMFL